MGKYVLISIAIIILLLDWLALDDITTRNEPSLLGEYLIVIASLPVLLVISYFLFRNKKG